MIVTRPHATLSCHAVLSRCLATTTHDANTQTTYYATTTCDKMRHYDLRLRTEIETCDLRHCDLRYCDLRLRPATSDEVRHDPQPTTTIVIVTIASCLRTMKKRRSAQSLQDGCKRGSAVSESVQSVRGQRTENNPAPSRVPWCSLPLSRTTLETLLKSPLVTPRGPQGEGW